MIQKAAEEKRLFFALKTTAPWARKLPSGRILQENHRHMTFAFLGNMDYAKLKALFSSMPLPEYQVGFVGKFDQVLFLPERHPHVVAWHVGWLDDVSSFLSYRKNLLTWLESHHLMKREERDFLPHVTLCRSPFVITDWKKAFVPLPVMTQEIVLYESVGNLQYMPLWSHPIQAPFEEIEHTADIAFLIKGKNLKELHNHAQIALAFRHPPFLEYVTSSVEVASLDDLIISLNDLVARADSADGCPFKAVSFHGKIVERGEGVLEWEMIVDV